MRIIGPFAAARQLDPASGTFPPPEVSTWQALDRITGLPALVYSLPREQKMPKLPPSPLLLPYTDAGAQDKRGYVAADLPPTAQPCQDAALMAEQGLRALMALHESGTVHGAVTPAQFWEDGGQLLLAGAALPWSELPEPYRAPEGGRSQAADLYAFGVTLLRLGPLPEGLSDLLSPYPAQRPSARDALARMNAGPRVASAPAPLVVDAPRPRLPEEVISVAEPLPLVADPDERVPDIDLQDTVLIPDQQSRLERQRREQNRPLRVADLDILTPMPAPAQEEVGPGPRVVKIVVPAQTEAPPELKVTPPSPEVSPSRLSLAETSLAGRVTVRRNGPNGPRPARERLGEVLRPVPEDERREEAPASLQEVTALAAPPVPLVEAAPQSPSEEAAALSEVALPAAETSAAEWVEEWTAQGMVYSSREEASASAAGTLPSRREFKPVKMAWNPDGSWQVKREEEAKPEHSGEAVKEAAIHAAQHAAQVARPLAERLWRAVRQLWHVALRTLTEAWQRLRSRGGPSSTSSQRALERLKRQARAKPEPSAEAVPVESLIVLSPETMPPEPAQVPAEPAPEPQLTEAPSAEVPAVTEEAPAPADLPPALQMPAASVKVVSRAEAAGLPRLLDDLGFPEIQPVVRQDAEAEPRPASFPERLRRARALHFPAWLWLTLLAALLLAALAWAALRHNAQVGGHVTPPIGSGECCRLKVQVFSGSGERLNLPVRVVVQSAPAGSHLTAGSTLGEAPGTLELDAAGRYTLSLRADSYLPASVSVDLPRSTPLNITLQ